MKDNNKKKKVALIGCGLIGQSWAISFLSAGFSVSLFDPTEGVTEAAKEKITARLSDLQNHGLIDMVVPRNELRERVTLTLNYLCDNSK